MMILSDYGRMLRDLIFSMEIITSHDLFKENPYAKLFFFLAEPFLIGPQREKMSLQTFF